MGGTFSRCFPRKFLQRYRSFPPIRRRRNAPLRRLRKRRRIPAYDNLAFEIPRRQDSFNTLASSSSRRNIGIRDQTPPYSTRQIVPRESREERNRWQPREDSFSTLDWSPPHRDHGIWDQTPPQSSRKIVPEAPRKERNRWRPSRRGFRPLATSTPDSSLDSDTFFEDEIDEPIPSYSRKRSCTWTAPLKGRSRFYPSLNEMQCEGPYLAWTDVIDAAYDFGLINEYDVWKFIRGEFDVDELRNLYYNLFDDRGFLAPRSEGFHDRSLRAYYAPSQQPRCLFPGRELRSRSYPYLPLYRYPVDRLLDTFTNSSSSTSLSETLSSPSLYETASSPSLYETAPSGSEDD